MSPDIYNGLVNLNEVLMSHGAEEELKQLKHEKEKIIKDSIYKSEIMTRGVRGYNTYWYSYYILISGKFRFLI